MLHNATLNCEGTPSIPVISVLNAYTKLLNGCGLSRSVYRVPCASVTEGGTRFTGEEKMARNEQQLSSGTASTLF